MESYRRIRIRKPFDLHVHLRDLLILLAVIEFTVQRFEKALIMPNLEPPDHIKTLAQALAYRERIMDAARPIMKRLGIPSFEALMTFYLTDDINPNEILNAWKQRVIVACKMYPAGATTNSELGITDLKKLVHIFRLMEKYGIILCIHGETVWWKGKEIPFAQREYVFFHEEFPWLREEFPNLRIVCEHLSTATGVRIVKGEDPRRTAATLTTHHPMKNEIDVLRGGMSTDLHCLPVLKPEEDRLAVRAAMVSGDPHFFLGTDSAPHPISRKRRHRAPGGILTAHAALELYADIFDDAGMIDNRFEAFSSLAGPKFYGFAPSNQYITLERNPWTVDNLISVPETEDVLWPFLYHEDPAQRQPIHWRIVQ